MFRQPHSQKLYLSSYFKPNYW